MAIGWSEIFVVAAVVLLVFGPQELPAAARALGRFLHEVRRMSGEARRIFEDALRDAEREAERKDDAGVAASAQPSAGAGISSAPPRPPPSEG